MKLTVVQREALSAAQRIDAIHRRNDLKIDVPPAEFAAYQLSANSGLYDRAAVPMFRNACYQLIRKGLMERARHGYYRLTALGREEA